jgi:RNA polymerase sigma-70 factor (ECF subfamily)
VDHEDPFRSDLIALIPRLRLWARSLARHREDADDLVQETLARAWMAEASFQRGTNLKAWTFQILRNQFLSRRRRAWREVEFDPSREEEELIQASNPDAVIELDELRRAMTTLSADQRQALLLVGAGGLTYEDAAAICGCAPGTMKSRVSRARAELHRILASGALPRRDEQRPYRRPHYGADSGAAASIG